MEEQICKNCKFFNGRCQNFYLSRVAKTKRKNENNCEYWEERIVQFEEGGKRLKETLLEIAFQLEKIAHTLKDDEE
ncbi:MAG: hypothetical protein K2G44_06075 [Clostridia bacterium]|nr:hypothetical protein [Clostridia bacterium]